MSFVEQVKVTGNVGGILDAASGASKPANVLQVGGTDGTNAYPFSTDSSGNQFIRPASPTSSKWTQSSISVSSSGANIIIPGVSGQTVRVMRMFFVNSSSTTTTNVTIQDTTPTSFTGSFLLISGGSFNGSDANGEPLFISASGKGIQLNSTAAVQLSGAVWYTQS